MTYELTDVKLVQSVTGLDYDAIELRIIAEKEKQRDRFERAYALQAGCTVESLKSYRTDNFDYRTDFTFLRGNWKGWQMREHLSGNDPFLGFMLDAASEAEYAAYEYGCEGMMAALADVLDSTERGGTSYEPWEGLKRRIYELKAKAARFDWLESQSNLELRSCGSAWKRPDGKTFIASHYLAAGNTQFAPQETLAATIDCARAVQEARK